MTQRFDYIIVGSGIAGLYAALLARRHGTVCVLTKGGIDECNTKYAQGGIAAAVGADDDPELHYCDTIEAGAGRGGPGTAPPPPRVPAAPHPRPLRSWGP